MSQPQTTDPTSPARTASAPDARVARNTFVGALAVSLLWELRALAMPPHGEHAWRDADGLGVARAFLHEGWNLFLPRVAERGAGPGVAGMELPLVNWLAAAAMRLFGESDAVARSIVWLSIVPLGLGMLALGRRLLGDERGARLAASLLVLQPLVLIFSRKLMPEVPMLALLTWGLALSHDALSPRGAAPGPRRWAVGGAVLLALAAVLKPTGAAAGVPVLLWARAALRRPGSRARTLLQVAILAGVPLGAAACWFAHARALDAASGLETFKLHHDWLAWTHLLFTAPFLGTVFGRILHLELLWPTVIVLVLRIRETVATLRARMELLAWLLAALALVIAFGPQNFQHAYYAIGLLPPLCLLAADALARVSRALPHGPALLAAFVAIFAVTAMIRAQPRFPPLGYDAEQVARALPHLPQGPAVVTDPASPVVALVVLHRTGWALPAARLNPERVRALAAQGATVLIDSTFGGRIPEELRATLPPPDYADAQLRAWRLAP